MFLAYHVRIEFDLQLSRHISTSTVVCHRVACRLKFFVKLVLKFCSLECALHRTGVPMPMLGGGAPAPRIGIGGEWRVFAAIDTVFAVIMAKAQHAHIAIYTLC